MGRGAADAIPEATFGGKGGASGERAPMDSRCGFVGPPVD